MTCPLPSNNQGVRSESLWVWDHIWPQSRKRVELSQAKLWNGNVFTLSTSFPFRGLPLPFRGLPLHSSPWPLTCPTQCLDPWYRLLPMLCLVIPATHGKAPTFPFEASVPLSILGGWPTQGLWAWGSWTFNCDTQQESQERSREIGDRWKKDSLSLPHQQSCG
jgi:hypothetical protein